MTLSEQGIIFPRLWNDINIQGWSSVGYRFYKEMCQRFTVKVQSFLVLTEWFMRCAKSSQLLFCSRFSGRKSMNPFDFSVCISLNIHRSILIFGIKYFSIKEHEESAQVKLQVRASFSALTSKNMFLVTYSLSGVLRTESFYGE